MPSEAELRNESLIIVQLARYGVKQNESLDNCIDEIEVRDKYIQNVRKRIEALNK